MKKRQSPSILFLVAVNALVLFGVTTIGISDPRAFMVTLLVLFLPLFALTLFGQFLVSRILRVRQVGDGTRAFLYLLPVVVVVLATPFLAPGLGQTDTTEPLPSPSSRYVLEVPIRNAAWTVRILDRDGKAVHEDAATEFFGRFNCSWRWDAEDRVWLLNGDTGDIFFWEQIGGEWKKERWGRIGGREIARPIDPPSDLFPPEIAVR